MYDIKNENQHHLKFCTDALYVLVFLFIARIISILYIPLNDSTEARYGEIARKMLETGNWVTLQHDYGVPFWAKPPLSSWLSAVSMKLFGVNEFAARLPGFLLSIGILWLVWSLAKNHGGRVIAMVSVLVLASALYFFIDAGAVMTDPALLFCTTLSIVAFWRALVDQNRLWSYLFFVGIGLGLLAKGPIAVVLVGLPLFFWVLVRNEWRHLWQRLPWVIGTLITLAIALPWYVLAELRTPGFLNYFIVGEHINRFLTPGWTGDKYGMAHDEPWGMIWIYAIAGIFPWSIVGTSWLVTYWKKIPVIFKDDDGWMSYLLLCTLLPLVFFTFASNIIYPYVLPSLPAFALLFAEIWHRTNKTDFSGQWIIRLSVVTGVIFIVATFVFYLAPQWVAKTQKPLVTAWKQQHPASGSNLVYWDYGSSFSAQFYSSGKVKATRDTAVLCKLLSNNMENFIAVNSQEINQIPRDVFSKCEVVAREKFKSTTMLLAHCSVLNCRG